MRKIYILWALLITVMLVLGACGTPEAETVTKTVTQPATTVTTTITPPATTVTSTVTKTVSQTTTTTTPATTTTTQPTAVEQEIEMAGCVSFGLTIKDVSMSETPTGVIITGFANTTAIMDVRFSIEVEFYDATGALIGTTEKENVVINWGGGLEFDIEFSIGQPSDIAKYKLIATCL